MNTVIDAGIHLDGWAHTMQWRQLHGSVRAHLAVTGLGGLTPARPCGVITADLWVATPSGHTGWAVCSVQCHWVRDTAGRQEYLHTAAGGEIAVDGGRWWWRGAGGGEGPRWYVVTTWHYPEHSDPQTLHRPLNVHRHGDPLTDPQTDPETHTDVRRHADSCTRPRRLAVKHVP